MVTGVAGYLGSVLCQQLLADGYEVVGLDSLRRSGEGVLGAYPTGRFRLLAGDIRDRQTVKRAVDGVQAVVHLAAIVGDPACAAEPVLAQEVNLDATVLLHRSAIEFGVERFVFASTCSVYGRVQGDDLADETYVLEPLSLYATAKVEAERRLLTTPGTAVTVLRNGTLFGLAPAMRYDLVANLFARQAALGKTLTVMEPQAWRPMTHVADAASAVRAVLRTPAVNSAGILNVVGTNITISDLAEQIATACGGAKIETAETSADRRDYRADGARLRAATGWLPRWSPGEGAAQIADAVRHGITGEADHVRA
ncbi:NAD-dependent epimerase/dehydratase family protein [Streptomyces sp. NPDC020379]|uniref:NAD-dependent epimerase/dehydratase family protein n=1 Tax=Streptomyces sp. NPDC020379 TaxID=3365071 RepID=UPI00378F7CF9